MILSRAQQTAAMVAARRRVLGNKRRRMPRQLPPSAVEASYRAALLRYAELGWSVLGELRAELPQLLASAAHDLHVDAGEGDRLRRLQERAKARLAASVKQDELNALAKEFARRTETYQRIQLERQTRAGLGADPFIQDRKLPALVNGFVVENAQLIANIPEKLMVDVALASSRALAQATPWPKLAVELEQKFGFAKDRARLIARDQIGKLYGQVNAARQKELGVTQFIWRTVKDDRVRGDPDGKYPKAEPSHYDREGKTYSYDDPPDGELPGEPINCRCYAEPVFGGILDELEAFQ